MGANSSLHRIRPNNYLPVLFKHLSGFGGVTLNNLILLFPNILTVPRLVFKHSRPELDELVRC